MDSWRQYNYCHMVWSQWFYPCGNNCNLNSDLLSKRHVFSCKKKSLIFGLQTCQQKTVISVCLTLIKGLHSVSLTFIKNLEKENDLKQNFLNDKLVILVMSLILKFSFFVNIFVVVVIIIIIINSSSSSMNSSRRNELVEFCIGM